MKRTIRKLPAVTAAVLLLFLLTGCGPGREMTSVTVGSLVYRGYGTIYGIERVTVSDGSGKSDELTIGKVKKGEPYSGDDGLNYGMNIADIDGDGLDDVVVQTSRTPGSETYEVFLSSEKGFRREDSLSGTPGVLFENGRIYRREHKRIYYVRGRADEPDIYDEYESKILYGRDVNGEFHEISEERLTYYSETDMYCFSTFSWDTESGRLENDVDKWIKPEKLEENGFRPFQNTED